MVASGSNQQPFGARVLVTGAGKRVGRAIACAFGVKKARVAVHYHSSRAGAAETKEIVDAAGGDGALYQADLYDADAGRQLVRDVTETFGGLDLMVLSAANFDRVPLEEVDDAAMDRALALNLKTPVAMAIEGLAELRKSQGSIVFVTGTGATRPYPNYLPYLISKGAVRQAMRTLAIECAPDVRVNAVAPGTVLPPDDMSDEQIAQLVKRIPLGRVGSAEDIAHAVVQLAESDFVTGAEWIIDGGRTLT